MAYSAGLVVSEVVLNSLIGVVALKVGMKMFPELVAYEVNTAYLMGFALEESKAYSAGLVVLKVVLNSLIGSIALKEGMALFLGLATLEMVDAMTVVEI